MGMRAGRASAGLKSLLEQVASFYCVPRAAGRGRKIVRRPMVRPGEPGPIVDELRDQALKFDAEADRWAVFALFDPLLRVEILKEIAERWHLGVELPDAAWILEEWVERYPDDKAMEEAFSALCAFLTRVCADLEEARRFAYTKRGLTWVVGSFAERHSRVVEPLKALLVGLEPDRRRPHDDDSLPFEGPALDYFSQLVFAVVPVYFERGFLSESEARMLLGRHPRLADCRQDLPGWRRWVQQAHWVMLYGMGTATAPPELGVERLVTLCLEKHCMQSWLLEELPPPNSQDHDCAAVLGCIPEANALIAAVCAPAWAPLLERAVQWPGMADLARLVAIFRKSFLSGWRQQSERLVLWLGSVELAGLRRQLAELSPARIELVKKSFTHYEAWYWVQALLGKGFKAIVNDVQHGRFRGFLALALVPRHPHWPAYRAAVKEYLAGLSSRSEQVRSRGLELGRFALGCLNSDPDLDRLGWQLAEQLRGR